MSKGNLWESMFTSRADARLHNIQAEELERLDRERSLQTASLARLGEMVLRLDAEAREEIGRMRVALEVLTEALIEIGFDRRRLARRIQDAIADADRVSGTGVPNQAASAEGSGPHLDDGDMFDIETDLFESDRKVSEPPMFVQPATAGLHHAETMIKAREAETLIKARHAPELLLQSTFAPMPEAKKPEPQLVPQPKPAAAAKPAPEPFLEPITIPRFPAATEPPPAPPAVLEVLPAVAPAPSPKPALAPPPLAIQATAASVPAAAPAIPAPPMATPAPAPTPEAFDARFELTPTTMPSFAYAMTLAPAGALEVRYDLTPTTMPSYAQAVAAAPTPAPVASMIDEREDVPPSIPEPSPLPAPTAAAVAAPAGKANPRQRARHGKAAPKRKPVQGGSLCKQCWAVVEGSPKGASVVCPKCASLS
jgi:hypothetical protein